MSTLGKRLKQLRNSRGLNQTQLSEALNEKFGLKTDRVMISKWETGFQTPVMNTVVMLAKFFNVSIDYLNGDESSKSDYINLPPPNITEDYTTFPVEVEIAAGYEHIALEDWEGDTVDISNDYLRGHNKSDFFVLRVKGDSMYPEYQDGDRVLILKQPTVNYSGQVGVAVYDGELATLKKIEYTEGESWVRLVPINPAFPPKLIENEDLEYLRVLGIPKLIIREVNK